MKKTVVVILVFLLSSLCHAQVASVFGVDAQAFLRDEKISYDIIR